MTTTANQKVSAADVQAHRDALETPAGVAAFLGDLLGFTLTAELASVDVSTARRWADSKTQPGTDPERKLRAAAQVARLLLQSDASHTVRAWFIGMNPQLGDSSPIDAIAEGHLKDVLSAARAFQDGA